MRIKFENFPKEKPIIQNTELFPSEFDFILVHPLTLSLLHDEIPL